MFRYRINVLLFWLIVVVTLPATLAYSYYRATKDPTLRPLGATSEELADNDSAGGTGAINVLIDWGDDSALQMTQEEVKAVLARTLNVFGADFWFTVRPVSGTAIKVSYVVGNNSYGPYPVARTAGGIRIAVSAQQALQKEP